jgi:hypothetical protein
MLSAPGYRAGNMHIGVIKVNRVYTDNHRISWFLVHNTNTQFDSVCLYTYEFWLSLCKIVRSSVILLLPLFREKQYLIPKSFNANTVKCDCRHCTHINTFINGTNSLKEKAWYYKRVNSSTVNSSSQRRRSCICL